MTALTEPTTASGPIAEDPDERAPLVRLTRLLDPGSPQPQHDADTSGVLAARGRGRDAPVLAFRTDATTTDGAMGMAGYAHIVAAIHTAVAERCPVSRTRTGDRRHRPGAAHRCGGGGHQSGTPAAAGSPRRCLPPPAGGGHNNIPLRTPSHREHLGVTQ